MDMQSDQEKLDRVWQRVRSGGGESPPALPVQNEMQLPELARQAQRAAAEFWQLSRRAGGGIGAQLRQLAGQKRAQAACLRGICALSGDQPLQGQTVPAAREPLGEQLRKCCEREMQCLCEYARRTGDGAFGQIFAHLTDRQRTLCQTVLMLLGTDQ